MHFDIIYSVFYTIFLALVSIYKGKHIFQDNFPLSDWWSPYIPSFNLGTWIHNNRFLLFHLALPSLLWVPCKPHWAHLLDDIVPDSNSVQHLILYLLQLPHYLCASDRTYSGSGRHLFRFSRNFDGHLCHRCVWKVQRNVIKVRYLFNYIINISI